MLNFLCLFHGYVNSRSTFLCWISSSGCRHAVLLFTNEELKTGWLMTCLYCTLVIHMPGMLVTLWPWSTFNQWHFPDAACQAIIQSMFYVCSCRGDIRHKTHTTFIFYTSLPTGLWTINLTTKLIISVLYKISLMSLQVLKSYPFFWNNCGNRTFM